MVTNEISLPQGGDRYFPAAFMPLTELYQPKGKREDQSNRTANEQLIGQDARQSTGDKNRAGPRGHYYSKQRAQQPRRKIRTHDLKRRRRAPRAPDQGTYEQHRR